MDGHCTYCRSDLAGYEPVVVERLLSGGGPTGEERPTGNEPPTGDERPTSHERPTDDERVDVGAFCNYACLSAHIDEAGLADGDACRWDPEG